MSAPMEVTKNQVIRETIVETLLRCKSMMGYGGVLAMYGTKKNKLDFIIENVSVKDFDSILESLDNISWVKRDRHCFYFEYEDKTLTVAILCD
jgi:hypothetical protein